MKTSSPSFLPQLLAAPVVAGSLFLLPAAIAQPSNPLNPKNWSPELRNGVIGLGGVGASIGFYLLLQDTKKKVDKIDNKLDNNFNLFKSDLENKTTKIKDDLGKTIDLVAGTLSSNSENNMKKIENRTKETRESFHNIISDIRKLQTNLEDITVDIERTRINTEEIKRLDK